MHSYSVSLSLFYPYVSSLKVNKPSGSGWHPRQGPCSWSDLLFSGFTDFRIQRLWGFSHSAVEGVQVFTVPGFGVSCSSVLGYSGLGSVAMSGEGFDLCWAWG